jgi:recombinational DNA repair ATPase RecF
MHTPLKDPSSADHDEVILFIKNLTKLRDTLEEKNAILESESDRSVAVLESEVARLGKELKTAQEW